MIEIVFLWIVLFEFQIFLNIGNIVCILVVFRVLLILIEFFGFKVDDWSVCCVGFDYWFYVQFFIVLNFVEF